MTNTYQCVVVSGLTYGRSHDQHTRNLNSDIKMFSGAKPGQAKQIITGSHTGVTFLGGGGKTQQHICIVYFE